MATLPLATGYLAKMILKGSEIEINDLKGILVSSYLSFVLDSEGWSFLALSPVSPGCSWIS